MKICAASLFLALAVAGCGGAVHTTTAREAAAHGAHTTLHVHPQAVQPVAGQQSAGSIKSAHAGTGGVQVQSVGPSDPLGDPNAHAPSLSEVRHELRLELVAVRATNASYIDPLRYVTVWGRTDQGVDAVMPVGAPILAPSEVKILNIEPDWYAGQPLVYFELLAGRDAGKVQYVAEQITSIAKPGSILQKGQAIARYAPSGTAIEYGWSTPNGITLAVATTGYEEGQMTPAGMAMRAWLNSLGANAGPNHH